MTTSNSRATEARRIWILGALDPEMSAIESLLLECGERVAYAVDAAGGRVHPGNAYGGWDMPDAWGSDVYLVECDPIRSGHLVRGAGNEPGRREPDDERPVLAGVIDHHRPGDRGYGRPPSDFLAASSIGQVIVTLIDIAGAYAEHALLGRLCALFGATEDTTADGRSRARAIDKPSVARDQRGGWIVEQNGLDEGDTGGLVTYRLPDDLVLTAAADHCLGAAYRGECPGVDPGRLKPRRPKTRLWRAG